MPQHPATRLPLLPLLLPIRAVPLGGLEEWVGAHRHRCRLQLHELAVGPVEGRHPRRHGWLGSAGGWLRRGAAGRHRSQQGSKWRRRCGFCWAPRKPCGLLGLAAPKQEVHSRLVLWLAGRLSTGKFLLLADPDAQPAFPSPHALKLQSNCGSQLLFAHPSPRRTNPPCLRARPRYRPFHAPCICIGPHQHRQLARQAAGEVTAATAAAAAAAAAPQHVAAGRQRAAAAAAAAAGESGGVGSQPCRVSCPAGFPPVNRPLSRDAVAADAAGSSGGRGWRRRQRRSRPGGAAGCPSVAAAAVAAAAAAAAAGGRRLGPRAAAAGARGG